MKHLLRGPVPEGGALHESFATLHSAHLKTLKKQTFNAVEDIWGVAANIRTAKCYCRRGDQRQKSAEKRHLSEPTRLIVSTEDLEPGRRL